MAGGSNYGRGKVYGRDQERPLRGGSDDVSKGVASNRGGVDPRTQGVLEIRDHERIPGKGTTLR